MSSSRRWISEGVRQFEKPLIGDDSNSEGFSHDEQVAVTSDEIFSMAGQSRGQEDIVGCITTALFADWGWGEARTFVFNPSQKRKRINVRKAPGENLGFAVKF